MVDPVNHLRLCKRILLLPKMCWMVKQDIQITLIDSTKKLKYVLVDRAWAIEINLIQAANDSYSTRGALRFLKQKIQLGRRPRPIEVDARLVGLGVFSTQFASKTYTYLISRTQQHKRVGPFRSDLTGHENGKRKRNKRPERRKRKPKDGNDFIA